VLNASRVMKSASIDHMHRDGAAAQAGLWLAHLSVMCSRGSSVAVQNLTILRGSFLTSTAGMLLLLVEGRVSSSGI
jgi:hypothetical protein